MYAHCLTRMRLHTPLMGLLDCPPSSRGGTSPASGCSFALNSNGQFSKCSSPPAMLPIHPVALLDLNQVSGSLSLKAQKRKGCGLPWHWTKGATPFAHGLFEAASGGQAQTCWGMGVVRSFSESQYLSAKEVVA